MTPTTEETRKRTSSDYVFGKVLGDGSFSTVFLARDIHTNKEYASKSTNTIYKTHYCFLNNFCKELLIMILLLLISELINEVSLNIKYDFW